jgi:glycosyltransferase involved in cell wall biosynthesis
MSQAMRRLGYDAATVVSHVYPAHARSDFDYLTSEFSCVPWMGGSGSALRAILLPYAQFLWLLPRFDVYHFFFSGGFLAGTPLQFLEAQFLHLAGKKVVVMPFGGDVAVPSHIHSMTFRQGLMMNYPQLGSQERLTLRWLAYFSKNADFIVGCIFHAETMPRWDLLTTHYYPIDTETWRPDSEAGAASRQGNTVTVAHAPNHRGLKGTEFLIAACEELQAEGYPINLRLLEGLPNAEIRRLLGECDILAEQFINGYGLTAMEGMSLAKPVMSNLSDDHYYEVHRLYTGLDECPILSTPIPKIKDHLRMLICDPERRKELGEAGRRYVLKYHSLEAVGTMWDTVYRQVWFGENLEFYAWHPDRPVLTKTR